MLGQWLISLAIFLGAAAALGIGLAFGRGRVRSGCAALARIEDGDIRYCELCDNCHAVESFAEKVP